VEPITLLYKVQTNHSNLNPKKTPFSKKFPFLPTSMRLYCLIVSTVAFFRTFASAQENWEKDPRCPRYGDETPALDNINPSRRWLEDGPAGTGEPIRRSNVAVKSTKNLRGVHRQLVEIYNFQLKMYWEEGYCWQNEWKDRKWCLECEETRCDPDNHLWLKKCDADKEEQRFTYEIINATTQEVKISPLGQKDLCWTAIGEKEMMLKECGDSYKDQVTGLDKQVLVGFAEGGRFQLHPKGFAESNPSVYKCISSHLHPKVSLRFSKECSTCFSCHAPLITFLNLHYPRRKISFMPTYVNRLALLT
jgi:hypothetical protein